MEHTNYASKRKAGKPMWSDHPHYPNKQERKCLVNLMKNSGMSELQVREIKENRVLLAKATKARPNDDCKVRHNRYQLEVKRAKREIAKRLGVEIWHPSVHKELTTPSEYGGLFYRNDSQLSAIKRKHNIR